MLPGLARHVAGVRRWAQGVAAAWGAAAADTGLVVSELVTNAIRHTRSGQPGGMVMVAIAGGWDGVTRPCTRPGRARRASAPAPPG